MWNRADDPVYTTLWNNNQWPVYSVSPANPGSDVAAEVAAAMALSSLIEFGNVFFYIIALVTETKSYVLLFSEW